MKGEVKSKEFSDELKPREKRPWHPAPVRAWRALWARGWDTGRSFSKPPFPLMRNGLFRMARSVKGALFRRGGANPWGLRAVLRRSRKRERSDADSIRFLKRNKWNGCGGNH